MSRLSASEVYTLLLHGGFTPGQARIMTAIAHAESGFDPAAVGDRALQNSTWGPSVGLFQVRTLNAETGTGADRDISHLTGNLQAQVAAAWRISKHGTDFTPWSTYLHGTYRSFLSEPVHEVALTSGLESSPAGTQNAGGTSTTGKTGTTGGTGDTLTTAGTSSGKTASADPFAIASGAKVSDADSDHDGLTDQFEKLLGTDPHQADTDHDGLSDAYETTISHTDPLSADTDHDGVLDGAEVALGTDPGHVDLPAAARAAGFAGLQTLDSDHDGLSDAYEQRIGTDPFAADSDHDGLPDGVEVARGSNPLLVDTNHDGLTDGFAAEHGLSTPLPSPTTDPLPDLGTTDVGTH